MGITVPDGDTACGLILLSKLKNYLGLTSSEGDDVLFVELGEGISEFIAQYCDRVFSNESYIEYHNIMEHGQKELTLNQYPITNPTEMAVYSVSWYGAGTETELEMDKDYWVYADAALIRFAANRHEGAKRIKAIYEAGYSEVPNDIQFVIMSWIARKWRERDRFGVSSQSNSVGGSTNYFSELTEEELRVLDRHRRKDLC